MIKKRALKKKARSLLASGLSRQQVYDQLYHKHPERKETLLEVLKYTATASLNQKYRFLIWIVSGLVFTYLCFNVFALIRVEHMETSHMVKVILAIIVQVIALITLRRETLKSFLLVFFIGFYGSFSYFNEFSQWKEMEIGIRIGLITLGLFLHFKLTGKYRRIKKLSTSPKSGKRTMEYIEFKN